MISKKFLQLINNHRIQIILVLFFVLIARFFPLLSGKTLLFGDNYSLMVPGKLFSAQWLNQGILPLWNPTIFTGLTWIGDVNQSIFYPSTLLFIWFNSALALNLTLIFHIVLAFMGMYLVSKKILKKHSSALISAIIWTLSTQITAVLNNISTLQSLSWLPMIVYLGLFINRSFKYQLFFSLAVLLQFAGGYPSHVVYSVLLAVIVSLLEKNKTISIKKWFWQWLVTGVFTIALSAIIWLPFIETLRNSTRVIQTQDQAISGSMHPLETIKLMLPYFFDHPAAGIKWGPSWNSMPNVAMYFSWIGLLTLTTFIFSAKKEKKEIIWLLIFISTFFFSFGGYLPIDLSFIIGASRGPSTALIATCFFAALIIGKFIFSLKIHKIYFLLGLGVLFSTAFTWYLTQNNFFEIWHKADDLVGNRLSHSPFHTIEKNRVIVDNIFHNLTINTVLFLTAALILKSKKYLLLIFVLALDLVINTQGMLFFAPNSVYPQLNTQFVFQEKLANDPQSRTLIRNYNSPYTDFGAYWEAVAVRQPLTDSYIDEQELTTFDHLKRMSIGMTPDWNMVADVRILNGYTTLMPLSVNEVWNEDALENPSINNLPEINLDNELLSDWSVKYYLVDHWFRGKQAFAHYDLIEEQDYWGLYELPALPRFRFADGEKEGQAPAGLTIEENPNQIKLKFDNEDDSTQLLIADRYDPNWVAEVNQQAVDVHETNHMRQIAIQPGTNEIMMRYQPIMFFLGAKISGVTLFASTVILLIPKSKIKVKS